jgi:hypothetical protein
LLYRRIGKKNEPSCRGRNSLISMNSCADSEMRDQYLKATYKPVFVLSAIISDEEGSELNSSCSFQEEPPFLSI